MNEWPEAIALQQALAAVGRRLVVGHAIEGAAVGTGLAVVLTFAGVRSVVMATILILLTALLRAALGDEWRWGWWKSLPSLARRLERRTPVARNLIVTASELDTRERRYVSDVVMARAAQVATQLDFAPLFPLHRTGIALAGAMLLLVVAFVLPRDSASIVARPFTGAGPPTVRRVEVTVIPPAYSGLPSTSAVNPASIQALANSRIELSVEATGASVRVETLAGVQEWLASGGPARGTVIADADGFIAIEARDSLGIAGPRRLMGLSVAADAPPRVTLASPGRDLFFSTVPSTIPVAINAADDLALASLRLQYTAVSGSGERFTFVEKEVPLTVNSASPRSWSARGTWRLDELDLAPGDLVVYRAVATDRRPGAPPVESESFVLEVVTPGAIAAEGFAADDQRDRYAVSQQMVILKTERLITRRTGLTADSIDYESRQLAAEQRQVRAEFVFMMGGEVEDLAAEAAGTLELNEVAEAEAEGDVLAGRLQNQGRVDMMRAIRAMSRASRALTDANLDQALRDERTALENLMRAFARTRFILRALTQRERIDLERRLSGSLNLTGGISGPAIEPRTDGAVVGLRRLMASVAAMASADSADARARGAVEAAMALLRENAGSDTLQRLAASVQEIDRQRRARNSAAVRFRVDSLMIDIAAALEARLSTAPDERARMEADVLAGALRDAVRGVRRRP